jgi:4-amino-4-deoxy-L-arabinose transferase-like glycosyltransferase
MAALLLSNRRFQITTVLILIASAIFFGWNLDAYSLINVTEARQAEIARQMWLTHDWITPRYNGEPYFDKPALLHWLIALGFAVFGPQEWVVRWPSCVSAISLLLATWCFLNAVATYRLALLTTGILAANPFTWALGRIGFHDMLMACFMALTLYFWFWADHQQQKIAYLWSCGCLALATLAKGPLAALLCLLIVPIFYLWSGKPAKSIPWGWGLWVFSALAAPWYVLVIRANGWDYIRYFFGESNVSRFLSVNQNQWGPPYYYLLSLCIFFFPWIIPVPSAIWRTIRQHWPASGSPPRSLDQFMVVWAITVLIFMSLAATKLSWYVYPGLPAFAYLSARAWEQRLPPHRGLRWAAGLICVIYSGLMIALATGRLGDPALLQSLEMAHLRWLWASLFAGAAGLVALSLKQQQVGWTIATGITVFGCIGLTSAHLLMPVLDTQVLDRQLIPIAQNLGQITCETCPTDLTATLGLQLPSLNFYSGLTHIERFEQACQIPEKVQPHQRLLLISTAEEIEAEELTFEVEQIQQQSGRFRLFQLLPAEQVDFNRRIMERCLRS